ncbi:MAG: hypothetical protein BWY94_02096 [Actinobacteria bacterium ADurb.BinA094]|nr:MAG: hypothetical protein BWY94_02096 [Actinobacteria bacterium ADurb.BinA094]
MGVDLCGGDRCVPEQLLDGAQISPSLEHVGRVRVPQHVRRRRIDARLPAVFYYEPTDVRREQRPAAAREQQHRLAPAAGHLRADGRGGEPRMAFKLAAAALEVAPQGGGRLLAERHDAGLAALAADHDLSLHGSHVAQAEPHQLHGAQAAAVEHLEDQAVAQGERVGALGRGDQSLHLGETQDARQPTTPARTGQAPRRVRRERPSLGEVTGEAAQGREFARQCGRGVAATPEVGAEAAHPTAVEPDDREVVLSEPLQQLLQVRGVGPEGGGAGAGHLEIAQERPMQARRIGLRRGVVCGVGLSGAALVRSCQRAPPEAT